MCAMSRRSCRKYVARVANFVFLLAVRFKVLPSWGTDVESGSLGGAGSSPLGAGGAYAPVPGGQRAEAERRRCVLFFASFSSLTSNGNAKERDQHAPSCGATLGCSRRSFRAFSC